MLFNKMQVFFYSENDIFKKNQEFETTSWFLPIQRESDNAEVIKGQLKKLVRYSVEEPLNEPLETEAKKLTQGCPVWAQWGR